MTNLCCDCSHYKPATAYGDKTMQATYAKCGRTAIQSLVHPLLDRLNAQYCDVERMAGDRCGPDARHFDPAHGTIPHDEDDAKRGQCECSDCVLDRVEMAELRAGDHA